MARDRSNPVPQVHSELLLWVRTCSIFSRNWLAPDNLARSPGLATGDYILILFPLFVQGNKFVLPLCLGASFLFYCHTKTWLISLSPRFYFPWLSGGDNMRFPWPLRHPSSWPHQFLKFFLYSFSALFCFLMRCLKQQSPFYLPDFV